MPERHHCLRLNRTQVLQLQRLISVAEDYAVSGQGLAFLAQQGTDERVAWLDLQVDVLELYRDIITRKGRPA